MRRVKKKGVVFEFKYNNKKRLQIKIKEKLKKRND